MLIITFYHTPRTLACKGRTFCELTAFQCTASMKLRNSGITQLACHSVSAVGHPSLIYPFSSRFNWEYAGQFKYFPIIRLVSPFTEQVNRQTCLSIEMLTSVLMSSLPAAIPNTTLVCPLTTELELTGCHLGLAKLLMFQNRTSPLLV